MEPTAARRPATGAIGLLRENGAFRAVWCSRSISFIGDSLGLVALLLYVADLVGTGASVALLLLVGDFTPTLFSPVLGTLSDRFDRKRLMIGSDLAQGVTVAVIALAEPSLAPLLCLVALRTILSSLFQPASRSAVTALVDDDRLETANAALGLGTHGFDLIGPLLAAALLPIAGVRGLLLADAATFLCSALLLVRLPALLPAPAQEAGRGAFLRDTVEGLRYIWDLPTLRIVLLGFSGVVAFTAADDVALVFLAKGPLDGGETAASLLYAGAGAGLLVGFLILSRSRAGLSPGGLMLFGFAVASGGNLLTGLSWSVPIAFGMQALRGGGIAPIDVGSNTLVQRLVPPHMQGRVFANLYGAVGLAAGLSYVAGGPLLDATGPRTVLIVAGAGGLAVTALTWLRLLPAMRDEVENPD